MTCFFYFSIKYLVSKKFLQNPKKFLGRKLQGIFRDSHTIFSQRTKYLISPLHSNTLPQSKHITMSSSNFQPTSNDSKMSSKFIDGVLNQNSACFTQGDSLGWSKISQEAVMLPTPYSPEWQGWTTEKKNFKRCGNQKCLTRQRNGRGFTCWVPGCGFAFETTMAAKRKYYCKSRPAPENYQQFRKKMRRKYNKKKREKSAEKASQAPKISQKASTPQTARVEIDSPLIFGVPAHIEGSENTELFMASDSGETLSDAKLWNLDSSEDDCMPPVLTRGDSLTPIERIDSNHSSSSSGAPISAMQNSIDLPTEFNYDEVPIPEFDVLQNDVESMLPGDYDIFDYFLSGIDNSTEV